MNTLIKKIDRPFDLRKIKFEKLEYEFAKALKDRALKAYFFGSYATKTHNADSDIDLIIIKDTNLSFTQRGKEFLDLFDLYPAIDLLIYTPDEFEKLTKIPQGHWKIIVTELKEILI